MKGIGMTVDVANNVVSLNIHSFGLLPEMPVLRHGGVFCINIPKKILSFRPVLSQMADHAVSRDRQYRLNRCLKAIESTKTATAVWLRQEDTSGASLAVKKSEIYSSLWASCDA